MSVGSGALGFGSGFARGFANGILRNAQEKRQKEQEEYERGLREFQMTWPIIWQNAQDTGDYTTAQSTFERMFPDQAKKMVKDGHSFDQLAPLLANPTIKQQEQALQAHDQASEEATQAGQPIPLLAMPAASAVATPPQPDPKSMFFGSPMPTAEQRAEKEGTMLATRTVAQQKILAKAAQKLHEADPQGYPTVQDALMALGVQTPLSRSAVGQTYAEGEITPDATSPTGFSQTLYLRADPSQQKKIPAAPPLSRSSRAVNPVEQVAFDLFGKQGEDPRAVMQRLTPDEMSKVITEKQKQDAAAAKQTATARGEAEIATKLNEPIGPTAAGLYNVPPTTTLAQLSQAVTLRPDQQEKISSLGQVDALLTEIGEGLPKVFPEVEPGVWGRIQTQFALGTKRLAADEDLAALDASINAALAQVAQLSGQPGSRLSDRDIELAKSTLAELKPSVFGGDTLKTAQARLGVLRRLLAKAQSGVIAPTAVAPPRAAPGGKPAPTGTPGAVMRGGKLYIDGVERGAP